MDVSAIDRSATRTDGPLRAASPTAKLIALAFVLLAVVTCWNSLVLASLGVGLVAVAVWGRLDLRLALGLAAYPALFALIFAAASAPSASAGVVIVEKAVVAALAAVIVVLSTPYPQIFAPIQRVTPVIVGDALLMTYRTTFLLLEKFSNLIRAIRLRAGIRGRHPLRTARISAAALGSLLLYSIDLAQRDYDVMRLRGYDRRMRIGPHRNPSRWASAVVIVAAVLGALTAVVWRVGAATLNPYSWVPLVLAATALLMVSALRRYDRVR